MDISVTVEEVPQSDLPDNIQPTTPEAVPSEDMPSNLSSAGNEVPQEDLPPEALQDKYGSAGEQAKTVAEQFAQGALGPIATGFETKVLGIILKIATGRAAANPVESTISNIAGNIGLMTVLPEIGAAEGAGALAKVGAYNDGMDGT